MADSAEKKHTAKIDAINDELSRGSRSSNSRMPVSGPGSVPPSAIPQASPSGNLQRALAELQRTSQPPPSVQPVSVAPRPLSGAPRPMIPRPSQMPSEPPPETRRFGEVPVPISGISQPPQDFAGYVLSSNTEPNGTPALAPPPSSSSAQPSTMSITSPLGSIMPPISKPASIGPIRTPSPMAVVGTSSRSSLRMASPGTAMMPQSAPNIPVPSSQQPVVEAPASSSPRSFGPPSGSARSAPPAAARISTPPRHDSVPPVRPSTQPRSFMPASALSRPPTASKSFSPTAGGPPQQYERAFRQWSSPNISEAPEPSVAVGAPVSFQVYTAKDVASGRGPMRSIAPVDFTPKKSSFALKFGMVLLGAIIVALTAAAVIAVSTEEPKKPVPTLNVAPPPPPAPLPVEPSKPSVITIGDDLPPPPVTAAPSSTGAPVSPAVKRSILRPPPRTPNNAPAPVAPPPNPYGK